MNITQRQGVIKVIPKKKKDRSYLENWRSLTLLNVDYKIATKTITHRISKVLPKLIDEDQTGYVNGRYISQNIRFIFTGTIGTNLASFQCYFSYSVIERWYSGTSI